MKYSRFNSIIPYEEKYALYNSLNQKVIFLEPILRDLLNAAKVEGIDEMATIHPSFYDYLLKKEFLVDESLDETEAVRKLVKSVDENHNYFSLTINPSMNCNFKCWYCYETFIKKSRLNEDMINRINMFITNTLSKKHMDYLTLSFFGGEPLLYFKKDVIPIIDCYVDSCKKKEVQPAVSFTTNGYLIDQDFVDYFNIINVKPSLQITLDGYREKHDKVRFVNANKGSYDKIIENIRLVLNNKYYVRIRINYTDENLEGTHKIGEEFLDIDKDILDNYLLIDFQRVWQNDQLDNLNVVLEKTTDILKDNELNVNTKYTPNNVLNSCYADKRNSAVINYNGDLFKCSARDFTTVKREGFLNEDGELVWENNSLENRMSAKFKNKPCLSCRIMPLCNGGCSQHAVEHLLSGEDYCVYQGDEHEKDLVVKNKIEEILFAKA